MLSQILVEIQKYQENSKKVLVVFDLDSTLFNVSPRTERILKDFAEVPLNQIRFPKEIQLLKNIKTQHTDWGITDSLTRLNLTENAEFLEAVQAYWQRHFFSNHYLQFDSLYEGALEYVRDLDQLGVEIIYLTGRDVERMGSGTFQILHDWGFPMHHRARLELKPHRSMNDAQFKTDFVIAADKQGYDKIYFFENEPVNLVHLKENGPHVEMIFFDSTHSGKAEPPQGIKSIVNFLKSTKES